MASILIVEDDDFFRAALRDYLKSKHHKVTEAPNGKVARDVLGATVFDLILTDVQMPFLDGVELLEWVKKNSKIPVIMMTGFTNLLETKTAYDLGADEFLTKPFKNEELVKAITSILDKQKGAQPQVEENADERFCKVSIEEFVTRSKVDFDVYVRLSETKYVKLAHQGDTIPTDRIGTYKQKGIKFLHILREDFGKLVDFNLQVAKLIKNNENIDSEKKISFMKYTGEVILEKAFIEGVDQESFNDARDFLNTTVSVLTESKETLDLLDVLNTHSDHIYAHSIGVSMYAAMIARKMGYESNQVFFKLSMAGIFHDIGKKEIDRTILEKARPLLTHKERSLIETHPTRGKEILTAIKGIPADVIQIVYEHHEDCLGQGYPRGLTKNQIHPLSLIMYVANIFTEQAIRGPHHNGMPGASAIEYIETIYLDRIDPKPLAALKTLFPDSLKKI